MAVAHMPTQQRSQPLVSKQTSSKKVLQGKQIKRKSLESLFITHAYDNYEGEKIA